MRRLEVVAYSGYRGEQEPRAVVLEGRRLAVDRVERRWREPAGDGYEVRLEDGSQLRLWLDREGAWWLADAREA